MVPWDTVMIHVVLGEGPTITRELRTLGYDYTQQYTQDGPLTKGHRGHTDRAITELDTLVGSHTVVLGPTCRITLLGQHGLSSPSQKRLCEGHSGGSLLCLQMGASTPATAMF